ncbi:hypothetical protein [Clostridium sp.]|uniref:hypothetical protein n=1 Tax=Clostridium sp. TaxID=1506 RepID=UPI003D6CDB53
MYCSKCGAQLLYNDVYCYECGGKVISSDETDSEISTKTDIENTVESLKSKNTFNFKTKKIKYGIIIICILLGTTFLFFKNSSPEKNIIGKWSSVVNEQTVTLEFKKDGKLLINAGNEDFDTINYMVEKKSESKNTIIIKEVGDESNAEILTIEFADKNNLSIISTNSKEILKFKRLK